MVDWRTPNVVFPSLRDRVAIITGAGQGLGCAFAKGFAAGGAIAIIAEGQALGAWFKRPETPTLIVLGTSLPQLFLTGFSWPREAIPKPVLAAGYIFPSDFAIDGLVRIDQLGASLWEVAHDWRGLWALAIIYFALAVFSEFVVKRRRRHG